MHGRELSPSEKVGVLVGVIFLTLIGFFVNNPGIFEKMSIIVFANWGFWMYLLLAAGFAIGCKYKYPRHFTWGEVGVQIVGSCMFILLLCELFFYYGGNTDDKEIWNGYVVQAEYQEWYEVEHCSESCDKDGRNCKKECSCVSYGPYWYLHTSNDEQVAIEKENYQHLVDRFNNQKQNGWNGDAVCHMGRIYVSDYTGQAELVPTALEHRYVNYLKASQSIRKRSAANTKGFEKLLKAYPRVYEGYFGAIELDRVLSSHVAVPKGWIDTVDRKLDVALSHLGKKKQVNLLVYLTGTSNQAFLYALEAHWINGKKNDAVLIIGTSEFPKIEWVAVMAWTQVEMFKITLRDRVQALGTLEGNEEALVDILVEEVSRPASEGGFERMSMEKLAYLASDVEIAVWAHLMIFLLGSLVNGLMAWALMHNEEKDYSTFDD